MWPFSFTNTVQILLQLKVQIQFYNYCFTFINCIIIFHHLISLHLPVIHMEPKRNFTPDPTDYNAPMYNTGAHAGVLSTTGDLSLII